MIIENYLFPIFFPFFQVFILFLKLWTKGENLFSLTNANASLATLISSTEKHVWGNVKHKIKLLYVFEKMKENEISILSYSLGKCQCWKGWNEA